MIELRCSSLPRILSCPASLEPPTVQIQGDDEMARLGSAAHRLAVCTVKGEEVFYDAIAATAKEFAVDADELKILSRLIELSWQPLAEHFPDPYCEISFECFDDENDIELTGHPDVFSIVGTTAHIADFKTGRVEGDHDEQLRGYAFLILDAYPDLTDVWAATVHVRQRMLGDPIIMSRADLDQWWAGVVRTVKQTHYQPSHEACQFCPRRHSCPARTELMRTTVQTFGCGGGAIGNLPDDQLRQGVIVARSLAKMCEDYLAAARTEVLIRGKPVDGIDATAIEGLQVTRQDRRTLTASAFDPLVQQLGMDRVKECLKISKTKIEKKIGEIAPPRGKGKLIAATLADLEAAGAVEVSVVEKLEVKPVRITHQGAST